MKDKCLPVAFYLMRFPAKSYRREEQQQREDRPVRRAHDQAV